MAYYADAKRIVKTGSPEKEHWNKTYSPGEEVPISGIYFCVACEEEAACNKGDPFPPQNHHQHSAGLSKIAWKLAVRTQKAS